MKPEDVLRAIESEASKEDFPIIGPERGAYLDEVVRMHRPKRVLEIGTLVGYSAIRMARLLPKGGRLTCVDANPAIIKVAASNFKKAGLTDHIEVICGDAKDVIPKLHGKYDMVFIDADKAPYLTYLKACERLLHKGSVVVADNVKSFADVLSEYLEYVRKSGKYESTYKEQLRAHRSRIDAVEISIKK